MQRLVSRMRRIIVVPSLALLILLLGFGSNIFVWERTTTSDENNVKVQAMGGTYFHNGENKTLSGASAKQLAHTLPYDGRHTEVASVTIDNETQTTAYFRPTIPEPPSGRVIIYAHYRTGSTFTSEFLFRHPEVAFMFEPLYLKDYQDFVTDGQGILWDLFNCRFRTPNIQRIDLVWRSYSLFCHVHNQTPGCVHGAKTPLDQVEAHCNQSSLKVVKVIRISYFRDLEEFLKESVKVIWIIRDPRAVVASRMTIHKKPSQRYWKAEKSAREYCMGGVEDFSFINKQLQEKPDFRNLHHIIRYEDIVRHPSEGMSKLYAFLKLDPDKEVRKWVESLRGSISTNTTRPKGYHIFNTLRSNPFETSQAWRQKLSNTDLKIIQKYCEPFMKLAGYVPVDDEVQLKNLSFPTVEDQIP